MNGVKHVRVAPYHAASNGLAERMVQSFKNHMRACKGSKLSIQQRIANFLLTYRSTKHSTTGRTPASLFLGRELRTQLTLLRPHTGEKVMDSQAKQKATHNVHTKFREFYPGDRILVKDLRRENTWWPGLVAERRAPKSYVWYLTMVEFGSDTWITLGEIARTVQFLSRTLQVIHRPAFRILHDTLL